ncbi:MAG: mandelate racemase/muconate lactonizing enzyme family protein [Thermomicrobiales bacterium]
MTIRSVEAIPLRIGFPKTFRFGTVDRKQSQNVIVKLTTADGVAGFGEACPVPAFTAETQSSIVESVEGPVRDLVVGADPLQIRPLIRRAERYLAHRPFTLTALDVALWDLAGKLLDVSVSTLLGGRFRDRIVVHGSVGWDTPEAMAETALTQRADGYATLKLYAGRDTVGGDLHRIAAVRAAVGPDVDLIVDVNGLWNVSQCLEALTALADLGVTLLEQPLPAWDELGQAEVVRASRIDVAADEAVYSAADVATIGRLRTARVINLGLSKLGGLQRARECETVARSVGLGLTVGSVLELGIASTAGLHLAAAAQELAHPSYLMGPLKYERQITAPEVRVVDGEMVVPVGAGLGIDVDEELLRSLDARR